MYHLATAELQKIWYIYVQVQRATGAYIMSSRKSSQLDSTAARPSIVDPLTGDTDMPSSDHQLEEDEEYLAEANAHR